MRACGWLVYHLRLPDSLESASTKIPSPLDLRVFRVFPRYRLLISRSSAPLLNSIDPPLEPDLSPLEGGRIESTYVGTWLILSSWFFFFFFFSHRRQNDRAGIIIDDRFEKGVSVLSGLRRRFRVVEILYVEHGKREGRGRTNRSRVNAGNDRTVFPACIDACEITRIR